jgi:hypothetical protein
VTLWILILLSFTDYNWSSKHKDFILSKIAPIDYNNGPFEIHGIDKFSSDDIKNSIASISPHGPTIYGSMTYNYAIYRLFNRPVAICLATALTRIPLFNFFASSVCHPIDVEPKNFIAKIKNNDTPFVIYSGGFHDVFENCLNPDQITITVNSKSRLYNILIESNKKLIPILVLNELENYRHPIFVVKFFQYIHKNLFRCGVPVPVPGSFWIPLFSINKTIMVCGDIIDCRKFESGEQLCIKHVQELERLYIQNKEKWNVKTNLKIIDYGNIHK